MWPNKADSTVYAVEFINSVKYEENVYMKVCIVHVGCVYIPNDDTSFSVAI